MSKEEEIYKCISTVNMGNHRSITSFDQYKHLSKDQKDFYTFEQLSKLDGLDKKYAGKRVEVIVYGFVTLILIGFVGALVGLVFTR